MKTKHKNITRYSYESQSFLGYRLCITRNHNLFYKYFSDKQYGGEKGAFAAALELRDKILQKLNEGTDPRRVFAEYR